MESFETVNWINNITPLDSKNSQFIQVIDVVMGAIGYYQNGLFEKKQASVSKVELMKYVFDRLVYARTMKFEGKQYMTVKSTKFNVWLFQPK